MARNDHSFRILDVHDRLESAGASDNASMRKQIVDGLSKPVGKKTLPTMLLYDEHGLRLYDTITTECPEYYLFSAEEAILKAKAGEIVKLMHSRDIEAGHTISSVLLELGAGALRKTSHILLALSELVSTADHGGGGRDHSDLPITYYALDLEKPELERTLRSLILSHGSELEGRIEANGMWGTYDDGLKFVSDGGLDKEWERGRSQSQERDSSAAEADSFYVFRENSRNARSTSPHSSASDYATYRSRSTRATSTTPPSSPGAEDGHKSSCSSTRPTHLLFLGSSLGNFSRDTSAPFLRSLPLRPGSGDTLLLGLDHDNAKDTVELAYNDPKGITRDFILNGLKVAGRALGDEGFFEKGKWKYVNRYNESERRHEAYYKSVTDQTFTLPGTETTISLLANEEVNVEVSYKYSNQDAYSLFTLSELRPIMRWTDPSNHYSLWLLERPGFTFPLLKAPQATNTRPTPFGTPTIDDFRVMWKAWDSITLGMIPRSMLFTKPIDLRHICLFYLGHIPTFLDIHLSRLLKEPHTEPENFKNIFERGIDPHVDDPSQCHPHSEVPQNDEDWPTLESIINFRNRVRARLSRLYDDLASGKRQLTRKIGRVLFMTFEHEAFHAETLLYMLLQGAGVPNGTLPPPGFATPQWEVLAEQWDAVPPTVDPTVILGPETIVLGHDDPEDEDEDPEKATILDGVEFGWDNEHPRREVEVKQFRISWRPVTNGEFYKYWKEDGKGKVSMPASWIESDGGVQVRTLYGPISMEKAAHWPVLTSYDDLSKYAQVQGGRLPTESELRLFYDKFECGYEGGANVGFRNWHPIPATTGGSKGSGKGHNGGVWEWTSTVFDNYEGFVSSKLYPGYSSDFFDKKHMVVMGGSYATIPRLSERRTLRNYYQHNYPYPWVAGRIAYDI